MTDDQQDINSEEVEQEETNEKVEEPKHSREELFIKFFLSLVASFIIVAMFSVALHSSGGCAQYPEEKGLLESLQSAAAIYVAQQRIMPEKFSDFVTPNYPMEDYAVLTLDNIDCSFEGLNTTELKVTFPSLDEQVTYYLDSTASFENYDNNVSASFEKTVQKEEIEVVQDYLSFFIPLLIVTAICFALFLQLNLTSIVWILFGVLCFIFFSCPSLTPTTNTKPAIYLYPTKPTIVNVTIDKDIDLSIDIPKYPPDKGWNVFAQPDGTIIDLQPEYTDCNKLDTDRFGMEYAKEACLQNNYPYLYWEGTPKTKHLPEQTHGWLVKTSDIKEFLTSKLDYVGFNTAEKDEFVRYWVHKISSYNQETVFISFMQTDVVNAYHSVTVTPTPDSINRFYIVVDLDVKKHTNPKPQKLKKFKRNGFSVVDWGGCVTAHDHR